MTQPPSPEHELSLPDDGLARTIRAYAEAFVSAAGPALGTMLNGRVTVRILSVEAVPAVDIVASLPLPCVVARLTFGRGLTGEHCLALRMADALALAQGLIGDQGVAGAEELEPAHEDALRTAANQIAAAAGPSLTPLLARSLTFAPAAIELAEDPASLPWSSTAADGPTWLITAEVSWGPGARAQFVLTTGTDLATEIDTISREVGVPARSREVRGPEALPSRMELILDITLPVTVELGRARMQIQDILKLGPGSIVELEKSAGDPVELLINERPIARGEVVVIDENFGIRLTSIVTPTERIKTLR